MKKLLILILIFLGSTVSAQKHWLKPLINKQEVKSYILVGIAGAADGTNQAIVYHKLGQGHSFWDFNTSWKRKYRNFDAGDKRAAFPGSKTILVGFTDGNHLTRLIERGALTGAIIFSVGEFKDYPKNQRWKLALKKFILLSIVNRATFEFTYGVIFKK